MSTVIKLGGELLFPEKQEELNCVISAIKTLRSRQEQVIIVHGGGPQTSALMKRQGVEPRMVAGRRITDEFALEALLMAVGGYVNTNLTSALLAQGLDAVGLTGLSNRCIVCEKQPPLSVTAEGGRLVDLGYVGKVTSVNVSFLNTFFTNDLIPVIACIGCDDSGKPYNINADTVASEIAVALKAQRLLLITGAPGVLRDKEDPKSRIPELNQHTGLEAIRQGWIVGGMIAKVEEAFEALKRGVEEIYILGNLSSGELLQALDKPGTIGTVLRT